jgi:hypothetical protein
LKHKGRGNAQAGGVIPLKMTANYNIHFVNKNYIFVATTQMEMVSQDKTQVIGSHLENLFTPAELFSLAPKIDRVIFSGDPIYYI